MVFRNAFHSALNCHWPAQYLLQVMSVLYISALLGRTSISLDSVLLGGKEKMGVAVRPTQERWDGLEDSVQEKRGGGEASHW